jgi:hypothetical protein
MMLSRKNSLHIIQCEVFGRSNQSVRPKRLFLVFEHSVLSYSSLEVATPPIHTKQVELVHVIMDITHSRLRTQL